MLTEYEDRNRSPLWNILGHPRTWLSSVACMACISSYEVKLLNAYKAEGR